MDQNSRLEFNFKIIDQMDMYSKNLIDNPSKCVALNDRSSDYLQKLRKL